MDSTESPRGAAPPSRGAVEPVDAAQAADAMVATCQKIDAALIPIIGHRGVAALYGRSLHLVAATHPWLAAAHAGVEAPMDLAVLKSVLARQSGAGAAAGGRALVRTFLDLLATLIGRSLTERLLLSVWEDLLSGPAAQDISP